MTIYSPTFNPTEFELRGTTNQYLSEIQATAVAQVENRVNAELDWIAQLLGWSGQNYWFNLVNSVNQKRQLLTGSFGYYNNYIFLRVVSIQNWDNRIIVEKDDRVKQGQKLFVGSLEYEIITLEETSAYYELYIGTLDETFLTAFTTEGQIKVESTTSQPAPFNRPSVGIAADSSFVCTVSGTSLTLFPGYDTQTRFPIAYINLFAESVYTFNRNVYLSYDGGTTKTIVSNFSSSLNAWVLQIPKTLSDQQAPSTATLVTEYTGSAGLTLATARVSILQWADPSDWKTTDVYNNFTGVWGNKGGSLPFNFAFDSLSLHGFNEATSIVFDPVDRSVEYNELLQKVYAQKLLVSPTPPPNPQEGDLWWNSNVGAFSVWADTIGECSPWVNIYYPQVPQSSLTPNFTYPDVATFALAEQGVPVGTFVRILNVAGLQPPAPPYPVPPYGYTILGLQGTLNGGAEAYLTKEPSGAWQIQEFTYLTVNAFNADALSLPFQVPVKVQDATGLRNNSANNYFVSGLQIQVTEALSILLTKFYTNRTWVLSPDSIVRFIANTRLFRPITPPVTTQGETWWDYANPIPDLRVASFFYSSPGPITYLENIDTGSALVDGIFTDIPLKQIVNPQEDTRGATVDFTVVGGTVTTWALNQPGDGYTQNEALEAENYLNVLFRVTGTSADAWVDINNELPASAPPASLNYQTLIVYCDGTALAEGVPLQTTDFSFEYVVDTATGNYVFTYNLFTLGSRVDPPVITISDSLTTEWKSDISQYVYSGIIYRMTANTINSETPLRLWKSQPLYAIDSTRLLSRQSYFNPLVADLNNGPANENWSNYFIRLPLEYGRDAFEWQLTTLVAQDFGYQGSDIVAEAMRCPPEDDIPYIYEELTLYGTYLPNRKYIYSEPYFYSNIAYFDFIGQGIYDNAGIFPSTEMPFDDFLEADLIDYEPLHERQAKTNLPYGQGFGDWEGTYVSTKSCEYLSGYLYNDVVDGSVDVIAAPVWDASIYKFAPTCDFMPESYAVDSNNYKVGYAYFVADLSAANEGFFDIEQETAWRYPVQLTKTNYITPQTLSG